MQENNENSIIEIMKSIKTPDKLKDSVSMLRASYREKYSDYFQSEEYLAEKQYFNELNDKFVALYHKYYDSYKDLINEVERKAYKTEFCKGGELIHRGYYSPSMSDLFFGNVKRGRLLKKAPIDCKFTYEYIFDQGNKLICVNKYDYSDDYLAHLSTEVFVYENNSVLAFTFSEGRDLPHSLNAITECQYEDDRLIRYEIAHFPPNCSDSVYSIDVESFEYSEDFVMLVDWYSFDTGPELLKHKQFSLNRDKNNYIVSIAEDDISRRKSRGISKEENIAVYPVTKKRK